MSDPDCNKLTSLNTSIWERGRKEGERLAALRALLTFDHPLAWSAAQAVEIAHSMFSMREEARQGNTRWARERGLAPHLWADRVAASWPDIEIRERPDRFFHLQRRRLEIALRHQCVWPRSAIEQIIHDNEPIQEVMRALVWIDEGDQLCWFDEHAQLHDTKGEAIASRALRMAHPAQPIVQSLMQSLDSSRLREWVDTTKAPFAQLERERFGPEWLELDRHGWYKPRWSEPLPVYKLMQYLRRRIGWRLTKPEDNGAVTGFYMYDERSNSTALWRMMNEQGEPRWHYSYMVYGGSLLPDHPLRVGLLMLRGHWDKSRLGSSF